MDPLMPIPDNRDEYFLLEYDVIIRNLCEEFFILFIEHPQKIIDEIEDDLELQVLIDNLISNINQWLPSDKSVSYTELYQTISFFNIKGFIEFFSGIPIEESLINKIINIFYKVRESVNSKFYTKTNLSFVVFNLLQQEFLKELYIVFERAPTQIDLDIINTVILGDKDTIEKMYNKVKIVSSSDNETVPEMVLELVKTKNITTMWTIHRDLILTMLNDIETYPNVDSMLILLVNNYYNSEIDFDEDGLYITNVNTNYKDILDIIETKYKRQLKTKFTTVIPWSLEERKKLSQSKEK